MINPKLGLGFGALVVITGCAKPGLHEADAAQARHQSQEICDQWYRSFKQSTQILSNLRIAPQDTGLAREFFESKRQYRDLGFACQASRLHLDSALLVLENDWNNAVQVAQLGDSVQERFESRYRKQLLKPKDSLKIMGPFP